MPAATEIAEAVERAATQLGDLPYLSPEQADAALTLAGVRTARDGAVAAGRSLVVRRPADLVPALAGVARPEYIVAGVVGGVVLWKAVPAIQRWHRQRAAGPGEDHTDPATTPEA